MPKDKKSIYFCQECGYESAKWQGQCPACKAWNTFVEEKISSFQNKKSGYKPSDITRLSEVKMLEYHRITTGYAEMDRVLGGGIVRGSLVLIGGDPGIGKSTLLLQVCKELSLQHMSVLYVSGEESPQQLKMRSERVGEQADMSLLCETNLEAVTDSIEKLHPDFVIIDSIQTMYSGEISSSPGSVSQVREATSLFMRIAKQQNITIFLVGHVTKEGIVAGPRVLEHMVDTVLYLEGDRYASYRILRGVKNRFGSTNELGVFEMNNTGLIEVSNPSEFMISGRQADASGSVISCAMEGTRCMLLEVQSLVTKSSFSIPRRTSVGCDINRLFLLMAVLEKRMGIRLSDYDAYVNIAGGIKINEPAMDLAICMAVISSANDIVIPADTVVFGEIGLSGEVRMVNLAQQRITEAHKLGFKRCIIPQVAVENVRIPKGMKVISVSNVRDFKSAEILNLF